MPWVCNLTHSSSPSHIPCKRTEANHPRLRWHKPKPAMALRASSTGCRPPSVPQLAQPSTTVAVPSKVITPSRRQQSTPAAAVTLPLFVLFTVPDKARALSIPKEQIVSSLTQAESAIDQIQELGSNFFDSAGQVFGAVSDAVKPALPVLTQAGEQAVRIASPVVSEASKKAQEALQSSGIDTEPVVTAAKTVADVAKQTSQVIDAAKPVVTSTVQTISTAEPSVILGVGGALVVGYFLLPSILSGISSSLRGYKGDLSAVKALDLMSTKNYVMIDIRSEKEKGKAGVPRLPNRAKNNLISIPLEELPNKLRSLVANVKKAEAELLATKISYLKKINKGSNIVLLDSYAGPAKAVARILTNLGFKNTWVVIDGFSGGKGWLQSRLGADSYNVSIAEVVTPSRVISPTSKQLSAPAGGSRLSTQRAPSGSAKLLPGGSD